MEINAEAPENPREDVGYRQSTNQNHDQLMKKLQEIKKRSGNSCDKLPILRLELNNGNGIYRYRYDFGEELIQTKKAKLIEIIYR